MQLARLSMYILAHRDIDNTGPKMGGGDRTTILEMEG